MIILEPLGGLANRMRVIASGIWLRKQLGGELSVIWNENYELNCPFELLFEPIADLRIIKKKRIYRVVKSSYQSRLFTRITTNILNKAAGVDHCIQEHDFINLVWRNEIDILEICRHKRNVYIQTCQEFGNNSYAFQFFSPVKSIFDKISQVTSTFGKRTVGVQIRRTDNAPSIRSSPVSLFTEMMERETVQDQETMFFLCSDDNDVKKEITGIFGDRVLSLKCDMSRETVQGMQDAVTDMFCLAATSRIYGSFYSSYSEVASRLNNAELIVLKINSKDA